MPSTRDQLQAHLDALHAQVPQLLNGSDDRDEFWPAFASLADPILEAAGPDDYDWVSSQITGILQLNDVSPPEA
ncbi:MULTISPECIES: hypothetical protein [Dyella]|uniref:Uncharacterized protein n=2 Tax=Dyella TaxID=231454 RepID=A0A4R0YNG1_9GAMM|nr:MULTISPECIES: hypothetical protein [Dyella]TBR37065.1 hypothetical protein EYV96_14350 [Dyella terrae]TCI07846.1 hypothetical protein EZM97_24520 [Dyella soli]